MKIGELEEQLQITRSNIRFYEKEGLLSPKRKGNGYREYSVEDAARLKQIAVLRKIGISIPDIKALLEERTEFSSVLKEHEHVLQEQIDTLNGALFVCRKMLSKVRL